MCDVDSIVKCINETEFSGDNLTTLQNVIETKIHAPIKAYEEEEEIFNPGWTKPTYGGRRRARRSRKMGRKAGRKSRRGRKSRSGSRRR